MTHIRFVEPISGYDITVPYYQWGQTEGLEYRERMLGTTPHGVVYRDKHRDSWGIPYTQRLLRVVFEQTDEVIQQLRTLAWFAMKNSGTVKVYPDASLPAFWWTEWQTTVEVERVIDNHLTIELTLMSGIETLPPVLVSVAQSVLEVFMRHDAAHLGQAVVEVVVRGNRAYVGQSVVEVMATGSTATTVRVGQAVIEVMIAP